MLSYTYVIDIVRHSDELETLKTALDNVQDGVVLLDKDMNAQFLNRKVKKFWQVSDERADTHPSFESLITNTNHAVSPETGLKNKALFFKQRVAEIKSGNPTPRDLVTPDGRMFALIAPCWMMAAG